MCGIAGIVRLRARIRDSDRLALVRMQDALRHRGPDDAGRFERDSVLLGHRRLAIIDLSSNGRQPLSNETGDVFLVYNGEIYNFRELRAELRAQEHEFRSSTDAEVLVHGYEQWGIEGLLGRLHGMFAFAIADFRRPEGQVFLARDRFGIKPLYVAPVSGGVVFASEVSALVAGGLIEIDPAEPSLASFLATGSIPTPSTALTGVETLPPAHYVCVEPDGWQPRRYWEFPVHPGAGADPESESVATGAGPGDGDIPRKLRQAVASQLVSDVPLGVFLSGGIDSASLVAIASRELDAPLTTLSVVFEDPVFDERDYARGVAERFGTDHREVEVGSDELEKALPDFWDAMDQPSVDGLNAFLVSRAAKRAGLTVVLSGLGGDEVFLGYPHHRTLRSLEPFLPWLRRTPRPLFDLARRFAGLPDKAHHLLEGRAYWAFRGLFTVREVEELAPGLAPPSLAGGAEEDSLENVVALEFEHYLHNQLLRDTDAMSMAHSIEARVPFLDHSLVEAVVRVPSSLKLDRRVNKPLLLRSLPEPLPREVWDRPKQGFTLPFAQFLRDHRALVLETTLAAGVFEPDGVNGLWSRFESGRTHWSRPWALASYAAWRTKLKAAVSRAHEIASAV